ncbi:restriction endonuclease subunit S [Ligilactobacillus salivarius]|uniref:Restriction endonuclease subunit S n=2 Tax=Ligilactobacillus salivarius TaxID=1624 RepID=A0A1Y0FA16_9LACO|nr:restriction endonuclease subunit S [Ligilactobacillus salivarius]ARU20189.1 restriction endonuclease subunit S [Ligilactobacillus salivarius]
MDNKKNGIPKLRFPGFTGAWEQRKLGEVGKTFTGLSGKTKEDFRHGDAHFVTYMNVYSNPISDPNMVENVEIDTKQQEVKKGDVFFTTSSETPEEVGMSSVWLSDAPHIYLNSFCFGFRPIVNIFNPYYLAYLLRSNNIRNKMMILAQGISRYNISKNKVMKLNVTIPNIREQQKIGEFFKQLDFLIALHQRKLEHLQEQKKGLLQKMFPKNGETVPEVRFPGFTDAWEQRKLGDLAEIVRGASPRPISDPKWFDDNSDIGWLRISDVTNQNGRIYYLEQHISKLGQEKTRVITEPHLLLSIAATVGKPLINYIKTGVHDGFLIFLNPKFDLEYMYQWLEMFRPKWNKYGQPGSQVNLNSNLVRKQKIALPSREEQQRISSFLKQLDSLIALHQRKLEHLELMKKGLLQQMFV